MPKYNVNNIPDGFEVCRKNRPLNLIDWEPEELWIETRNIIREEWEKTKRSKKEGIIKMDDRKTLKIVKKSGRRQT